MLYAFKIGLKFSPCGLNARMLTEEASKSSDMNVQLLSQFVSPYTGRVYGRHITGLCIPMQKRVATLIDRSRKFGFMANESKETVYFDDPSILANKRT
uniref:28S ribosomal protein S18c mitochondrial n=1 Tax=Echinococcus granulosus TaxID=6210 RepID=A0A068WTX3_ECHGR|nr:28S ribosomal protein S18c mitochondrial [Echinococcus granulosus]